MKVLKISLLWSENSIDSRNNYCYYYRCSSSCYWWWW